MLRIFPTANGFIFVRRFIYLICIDATMSSRGHGGVDAIDRVILQILMQDPRMPYTEIQAELADAGHEMSAEGVRRRVKRLFDESAIFLLTGPQGQDFEVVRVDVVTVDEPGATSAVFEAMAESTYWLVCRGFGTVDVHGVATVGDVREAEQIVSELRAIEEVDSVSYFIETERHTAMRRYANLDIDEEPDPG